MVDADRQQGVRSDVGFENAVVHLFLLLVVILITLLVLLRADKTAAQGAAAVKRSGNIAFAAIVVPAAGTAGERGLELCGGFLADQVHRRGRIAGAGHQAGRALEHFDPVIDGHVDMGGALVINTVINGVHTVILVVGDDQAAAGKFGAVAVVGLRRYTGSIA
ncbi:hypothetical protein D3C80_743400 [compost metagenome]